MLTMLVDTSQRWFGEDTVRVKGTTESKVVVVSRCSA